MDALEMALWLREVDRGQLVHHSDRGCQYASIRFAERLEAAGIAPSVGSKGDAYDNAAAEAVIGPYKTELIHRGVWRTREQVEFAALEWVSWYNERRLHSSIQDLPPAEYEAIWAALAVFSPIGPENQPPECLLRAPNGSGVTGVRAIDLAFASSPSRDADGKNPNPRTHTR